MTKNIYHFLFALFCFSLLLTQESLSRDFYTSGKDHGKISSKHINVLEKFIERNFKENKQFSREKTNAFLERLKQERASIASDIVETKIIEEVELYVKKPSKVSKKQKKPERMTKEELLITMDQYLIPKIKKLIAYIETGAKKPEIKAIIHDFIRGYANYYIPNAHRSIFPFDVDFEHAAVHIIKRFSFKKNDEKKPEAVNLQIQSQNHKEINKCLSKKRRIGHYLSPREIAELKSCNYDLSTINPGVSSLWHKKTKEDIMEQKKNYRQYYPRPDEKVYYNKMIYRGAGSPKFNVYYIRDGKRVKVKLKIGTEVHSEIVASELMRLCGMNQDHMRYQKSLKLYLGKKTYEEFISEMANKTGTELANRFIWGHGGQRGDEWVIIKDFLYEIRPENELRIANIDFFSWDFTDRREFRSLLLLWGWLALNDTKHENFRVIMKKKEDGSLYPLYRFQDTGVALGTQFYIEKPIDAIRFFQFYKVNSFPSSFVKKDKEEDKIKVLWNDFAGRKSRFKRTNWNDLKWMARLINKIKKEDISRILNEAGIPKPVADLYYIKLLSRRNDLIEAFELENEFKKEILPDLKNFNQMDADGNLVIKKGKIIKTFFKGQNDVPQVTEKWSTFIPARIKDITTLLTDFTGSELWTKISNQLKYGANPESDIGASGSIGLEQYEKNGNFLVIPLGVGLQLLVAREVRTSLQLITTAGKTHQYITKDRFKLRFYGSSPWLNEALSKVKNVSFNFDLKFFEKEYTLVRFSDTVKEAYMKKFDLFEAMFNLKSYATKKLKPMEFIKTSGNYGIEFDASISYDPASFLISNAINLGFRVKKYLINHYARDAHGRFIVIKEKTHRNNFSMGLKLLEVNTFQAKLPLFNFGFGFGSFNMDFNSYALKRDKTQREGTENYLTEELKKKQETLLKKGIEKNDAFVREYHVETKGKHSNLKIGGLFLFNKEKSKASAITNISTNDGLDKNFYHYAKMKETSFGVTEMAIDYGQTEILTRNRKRVEIAAESDLDKEGSTVYVIRTTDFYRTRTREKVIRLINDLNRRYSESKKLGFYRNYDIPEEMESGIFRKIYAMTRIMVSGEKFLDKFEKLTEDLLIDLIDRHFRSVDEKDLSFFTKISIKMAKDRIINSYRKLKKIKGDIQKSNIKRVKYVSKILFDLKTEIFGMRFLRKLMSEDGLFVMGDISGISRNFSLLQSLQQQQKRRFAGKSWGTLKKKPPLQKFMREHRYVAFSIYVDKSVKDKEYLGELQTGTATNIDHISNKNHIF